jgi:Peptidase M60, enhancin and enhancin-like/N-terminal domain of M60-like peptidases
MIRKCLHHLSATTTPALLLLLCLSFGYWGDAHAETGTTNAVQILRSALLKDVQAIDTGGIPGVLICDGEHAWPLIMGKINKAEMPVACAASYERGRIIALGHPGFYSKAGFEMADTATFMRNAFRWTLQDNKTILVFKNPSLIPVLQALLGKEVQVSELKDWGQLSTNTATVVGYAEDIPAREIERVRSYLKQGGGFMTSAIGWGWMMSTKKSVKDESRFNQLLNPAGLSVADGCLERSSEKGFAVKPIPAGATVLEALDMVAAGQPAKANWTQASATLCAQMTLLDDQNTSPIAKRLTALMESKAANKVPTLQRPVTEKDVAARLKLIAFQSAWEQKPLQHWSAAPAASSYPGIVSNDVPRVPKTLTIPLSVPKWHSTGLFASAGEAITVILAPGAEQKKLKLRIGSTTCDNTRHAKWVRAPKVDVEIPLTTETTTCSSPFGGLVYVVVPEQMKGDERTATVTIRGCSQAAWFKVGRDTLADWETLKAAPAPYGEIEGRNIILTVPRALLQTVTNPVALMKFWDDVADQDAKLAALPTTRRYPERIVSDDQLCVGYMHAGYPIMYHTPTAQELVNLDELKTNGSWGFFHEIGHNHQNPDWTFQGAGEVTVNFFTLYCMEKICGLTPRQTRIGENQPLKSGTPRAYAEWLKNGKPYETWKREPFLALEMFVRIQEAYGWEVFEKLFAAYRQLPDDQRPKSDLDKRDQWCTRLSRLTGENVASVFESWNIPISDEARKVCAQYPKPKDTRLFAN